MVSKRLTILFCISLAIISLTACSKDKESGLINSIFVEKKEGTPDSSNVSGKMPDITIERSCSDETFEALSDSYTSLYEINKAVMEYYYNAEDIPQDEELESILNSAQKYLDMEDMFKQNLISEDEVKEIERSMSEVTDALTTYAMSNGIEIH